MITKETLIFEDNHVFINSILPVYLNLHEGHDSHCAINTYTEATATLTLGISIRTIRIS